jgi:hypothetical protein
MLTIGPSIVVSAIVVLLFLIIIANGSTIA